MGRTSHSLTMVTLAVCLLTARAGAQDPDPGAHEQPPAAPTPESAPAPKDGSEPLDFTGEIGPSGEPPPAAQPPPLLGVSAAPPREAQAATLASPTNSLNLSVLGFVIGAVRLTYERMVLPQHGVFGEAIVTPDLLRGSAFVGVGGAAGYRFHWHGPKTSGFVGATLSITRASGTVPTFQFGDRDLPEFRGSVWTFGIAPHVGKRWLFERSGVNLTLRVGGGLGYHVVDAWRGSEPGAKRNLERSFFLTDGELSVGYSF